MFSYCGNNPATQHDPQGHSGELVLQWSVYAAFLAFIDGPLPIGDIIYVGGFVVCDIIEFVNTIGAENLAFLASEGPNAGQNLINQISTAASNPPPGGPNWGHGFKTFEALKRYLGSAGEGCQWHHIVEQCQINKSGFDPTSIHNEENVVSIPIEIHNKISAYYSSVFDFTNGMRLRDWLAGQSFEVQYQFGLDVLAMFGVTK